MTYKIGFEMDAIRRRAEADLSDALLEIGRAGYEGTELSGLFGHSPEEVREWAKTAGLSIFAARVGLDDFLADPGKTVLDYRELGCDYLVISGLTEKWKKASNYRWLVKQLAQLGGYCDQFNIQLLYHNYDFETRLTQANGENLLNSLCADVPDHFLKLELDTAWLKIAGENPATYLAIYGGRSPAVQIKDFTETAAGPRFCPLGQGSQNIDEMVAAAVRAGAKWLIAGQEGEDALSPDAMRLSAEYLRRYRQADETGGQGIFRG